MSDASAYYVCDPVFHYPAAVGKTLTFYAIYAPAEEAGVYTSWGDVVTVQMLVGKKNVDCQGFDKPEDVLSSFHGVCRRVHRHLSPPRPQPGVLYFNLDYFYNTFNPSLPPHKRYRKPVLTMPSPTVPPAIAPPPAASSTPSQGPGSSRAPHPTTAIRASTSSPPPIAAGVGRTLSSSTPTAARSAPSARASSASSPSQYNTAPTTSSQHRTPAAAASSTPSRAMSRASSAGGPAASVSAPPSSKDPPSSKKHRSSAHSQPQSKKHSRASSVATSSSYAFADCSSWAEEAAAAMSNLDIQSVTSASSARRSAATTDPWRSFVVGADGVQPMRFTSRREAQGACEALIHAGHRNAAVRKVESEEEERRLMRRFL